jgi:hypothetical protein
VLWERNLLHGENGSSPLPVGEGSGVRVHMPRTNARASAQRNGGPNYFDPFLLSAFTIKLFRTFVSVCFFFAASLCSRSIVSCGKAVENITFFLPILAFLLRVQANSSIRARSAWVCAAPEYPLNQIDRIGNCCLAIAVNVGCLRGYRRRSVAKDVIDQVNNIRDIDLA